MEPAGSIPVVLSSGDLGWARLVAQVAEFLEAKGYFVVGFNSRAYLASFTTSCSALSPQDVPKDYQTLIDFARQGQLSKPILAGVSEGAGLSVLAATRSSNGVGLPDENELVAMARLHHLDYQKDSKRTQFQRARHHSQSESSASGRDSRDTR